MQDYRRVFKIILPKYKYIIRAVIGLYFKNIYGIITVTMVTPQRWEKNIFYDNLDPKLTRAIKANARAENPFEPP